MQICERRREGKGEERRGEKRRVTNPPQVADRFVETGRKDGIDIAKDSFVILEGQLASEKPHNVLESLVARALESRLSELERIGQRRQSNGDYICARQGSSAE